MTWTLLVPCDNGTPHRIADIDNSDGIVVINPLYTDDFIVVDMSWDDFCKVVAAYGYEVNYINNTITTRFHPLDEIESQTDFEVMFADKHHVVGEEPAFKVSLLRRIATLLSNFAITITSMYDGKYRFMN